MKPILQTSMLPANNSFIVQKVESSYFETGWHYHTAFELILFTEGSGSAHIGDCAVKFETGDNFFLGSNLSHCFQKNCNHPISAVVIHFKEDCWGNQFMNLPECRHIKKIMEMANYGIKFIGNNNHSLQTLIKILETAIDADRIILLLQCLQLMAAAKQSIKICNQLISNRNQINTIPIDKVFQFTQIMFREPISLSQVASVACMSVSAFCHYFKHCTQKTYITLLNEVRITYACSLLLETNKSVTDICYESGYNTITHFHREFFKLKKTTPLQYRKTFSWAQTVIA